ncbi:MAG: AI-2E family transporter [Planctomycetes bacterium]|nr:AI-2E family transporter [Planctomycetota bacterium]
MSPLDRYLPELSERSRRWLRFAALTTALALLIWGVAALRQVLTPLAAAFVLAYVLNPAVTWLERRRRIPRSASVGVGLVLLLLAAGVLIFACAVQLIEFANHLPAYWREMSAWGARIAESVDKDLPGPLRRLLPSEHAATAPATQAAGGALAAVPDYGLEVAKSILGAISGLLANLVYWGTVVVLLPMYTYFLLVHFNDIVRAIRDHLPEQSRGVVVEVVSTIDRSIANFFRGRMLVCIGIGICCGIGWTIVGVPHGLPLGALAGLLSLIPFMSVLVLPPTLLLAYLDASRAGEPWMWAVLWVFIVYMIVQAIESFVLSPVIESRTSGLHPMAVVVALLIGNQVAGLLGMLLAIPVASTLKSLGGRYLLPEIRRVAGMHDPPAEQSPVPPAAKPPKDPT